MQVVLKMAVPQLSAALIRLRLVMQTNPHGLGAGTRIVESSVVLMAVHKSRDGRGEQICIYLYVERDFF
jgi:hypothetical protein